MLKDAYDWIWTEHGTKAIGFAQVTVGAVATAGVIESPSALKLIVTVSGLLTAWRGFLNSAKKEP